MGESKTAGERFLAAFPAAPYLTFGLLLAWTGVAYSGFIVLPGVAVNTPGVSFMSTLSGIANGITLVACALFARVIERVFENRQVFLGCGVATALACLLALGIGVYAGDSLARAGALGVLYALTGAATALVFVRIGWMYSGLTARKAVLYLALSHVLAAFIFFVVIGMHGWVIPGTSDHFSGYLALVGLPLLMGVGAWLQPQPEENESTEVKPPKRYDDHFKALPVSFWKLLVVILVLSFVMQMVSASAAGGEVTSKFDASRLTNFLRIVIGIALAWSALTAGAERFRLGRAYTFIMVVSILFVTVLPVMREVFAGWGLVASFVMLLFRTLHWVILCIIVCQKNISPALVFGLGAGVQSIGSSMGILFGSRALDGVVAVSGEFAVSVVLTAIVVVCAFLLFSEKDFDRLFDPVGEEESSLEDLFAEEVFSEGAAIDSGEADAGSSRALFSEAVDALAERHGLSNRESEVFRCLAMGFTASMVSEKLCISWNTVRGHSRNVYAKLGVHSRQELMELVDAEKVNRA